MHALLTHPLPIATGPAHAGWWIFAAATTAAVAPAGLIAWTPAIAALGMLAQAGFALVETGLGRAKNAAHTMAMALLTYGLGITGFFVTGFALMCAGIGARHAAAVIGHAQTLGVLNNLVTTGRKGWGMFGGGKFLLIGLNRNPASSSLFLLTSLYMVVAATIPTGALIERWRFKSFALFTLLVGGLIFPVYGCWVWGGGWLAQLGPLRGLGHGVVDYGGSSVVHLLGGCLALVGSLTLGPRLGKYDESLRPRPIFGHNVPMVVIGTLLLALTFFTLNIARSYAADDGLAATIALNTSLAAAASAVAAALYMGSVYGKPDPSLMCNGMLAGLVASAAGAPFIAPWAAFVIGAAAGILSAMSVLFLERRGLDDPVGAISVHGVAGLWGMLAIGLFADGSAGDHYNGVAGNVAGLFHGGGAQFLGQCVGVGACLLWSLGTGYLAFTLIGRFLGDNRVSAEIEIAGLDIPEMGAPGYPEFITHTAPEQVTMSQVMASRV